MKILCVYHNQAENYLEPNPSELFTEHNVTNTHTYEDAIEHMRIANRNNSPFDAVLTDVYLQGNRTVPIGPYGVLLGAMHMSLNQVKAVGIFIPKELSEIGHFESQEDREVFIASNTCWTIDDQRDWQRLLRMIIFRLERIGVHV